MKSVVLNLLVILVAIGQVSSRLVLPSDLMNIKRKSYKGGMVIYDVKHRQQVTPNIGRGVHFNQSSANPLSHVQGLTGHSGYLKVDNSSDSALFYIFYRRRGPVRPDTPLVIWLSGGPGCSSTYGLFYEIGPFSIKDGEEIPRALTWTDHFHLLFVDQPVGTGASYASSYDALSRDCGKVGKYFDHALREFYQLPEFADLAESPLYIFGESYAGKYIPCVASGILEQNREGDILERKIPLKGIAMGNGATDTINMLRIHANDSFFNSIIDPKLRDMLNARFPEVLEAHEKRDNYRALMLANKNILKIVNSGGGVNVYNRRHYGNYHFPEIEEYGTSDKFRTRYRIPLGIEFRGCDPTIYESMLDDYFVSEVERVGKLLEDGVRVMFYTGKDDLIVPTSYTEEMLFRMQWRGREGFNRKKLKIWRGAKGNLGSAKNFGNLWLALVNQAGHLVPMEQPESAMDLAIRFIKGDRKWSEPRHKE